MFFSVKFTVSFSFLFLFTGKMIFLRQYMRVAHISARTESADILPYLWIRKVWEYVELSLITQFCQSAHK